MVEWFTIRYGNDAVRTLATELDPRWTAYLHPDAPSLGIVHTTWYDEELASNLAERILASVAERGDDPGDALTQIGAITVERSLGRIARAALGWFASPETTAVSAQMFWRLYHSRGTISASVDGNAMHAVGTGWAIHGEAWCSVVGASARHVLFLAGCLEPRLERHICAGGLKQCEMVLRWSG